MCWYIAVLTLMKSLQAKEAGSRTRARHRALTLPEDRCCVVREAMNGGFTGIHLSHQDFVMGDTGGELQVAIGDGTVGVGIRHYMGLHGGRKR
jgi:hypothetical protein